MSELGRGRFHLTANVNHGGRVRTAKVFDKSDPEGADAAKREFKNLKALKHERLVSLDMTTSWNRLSSKTCGIDIGAQLGGLWQ